MGVRVRYAGPRRIRVTDGHEAEARAAQLRKAPNRVGLFVLRLLGYRNEAAPPAHQTDHVAAPQHDLGGTGHHGHSVDGH